MMDSSIIRIQRKPILYSAIQYTGPDSIPAIQIFVTPQSPGYRHAADAKDRQLTVAVRDAKSETAWPSLGKQYLNVVVPVGAYIVKGEDGELIVVGEDQMAAEFLVMDDGDSAVVREAAVARRTAAFGLGNPIVATHPRATKHMSDGRQPDDIAAD